MKTNLLSDVLGWGGLYLLVPVFVVLLTLAVSWPLVRMGWSPEIILICGGLLAIVSVIFIYYYQSAYQARSGWSSLHDQLRYAEQRYQITLENCLDAVITIDQAGLVCEWNRQAVKFFGWKREEVLGRSLRDLIIPEELRAAHQQGLETFLRTGAGPLLNRRVEVQALQRTGERVSIELTIIPVDTSAGWLFTAFVRNLTERNFIEQRFRATVEAAPTAMVMINAEGEIVMVNTETEKLFGYTRGELLGKYVEMLIPDRYRAEHPELRMGYFEEPKARRMGVGLDLFGVRKDGSEFPVEIGLNPVRTDEGLFVLSAIIDVTQRKRLEQRFRATVEAAPTAMVMINSQGEIVLVNSETEKLFGYSREELLGQQVERLVPERFRADHPQMRSGFFANPQARRMGAGRDLFGLRKDGSEFPVEIGLNPVETDEGLFVLSAVVDITARKFAESELKYLNEKLEQRVEERTLELSTALHDLTRAKEVAVAANRAKSAFLANMSHEIRTPLNGVIGMTELLLQTQLTAEQRDYLNTVRSSGESLLNVINDILDFSKIEAERLDLEQIIFNHAEMLGDTLKTLSFRAHRKGLELICRITPEVPIMLQGDPNRLRQVVVNLVSNAIKFTEKGDVVVEVSSAYPTNETVQLRYEIRDTGIGIDAEKLQKIFEPFEQADTSTTRRFGGTGLGLAISSRLVKLMGGHISVESSSERGSIFRFSANFGIPTQQPVPCLPVDSEALRNMSVLVVDDNATNRRILQEMLAGWGLVPVTADSGSRAWEMARDAYEKHDPFPLIISDVQMPGVSGMDLVRLMKHDPQLEKTNFILLGSGDRPNDLILNREQGVASYLMKPVKQSELLEAIMLAVGMSDETKMESVEIKATTPTVSSIRSLKIMLAEDSAVNQKLAVLLLTKQGHQVDVAMNGLEALEKWKQSAYDLILMDIQMPEMDGLEATKLLRAFEIQSGTRTPIIAMTAHAMKGDREMCLAAGMDDYVSKPIRQQELLAAIQRIKGTPPSSAYDLQTADCEGDVASKPPQPIIDWSLALKAAFNNSTTLQRLSKMSLSETATLFVQLRKAVHREDAKALERVAQTLRGHFRHFGFSAADHVAFHIENTARDGRVDCEPAIAALERHLDRFQAEIQAFLDRQNSLPKVMKD
jgi:two-component system, sensor histidine kinase and response regulator